MHSWGLGFRLQGVGLRCNVITSLLTLTHELSTTAAGPRIQSQTLDYTRHLLLALVGVAIAQDRE